MRSENVARFRSTFGLNKTFSLFIQHEFKLQVSLSLISNQDNLNISTPKYNEVRCRSHIFGSVDNTMSYDFIIDVSVNSIMQCANNYLNFKYSSLTLFIAE